MSDPKRMCYEVDLVKMINISYWTYLLISIRKIHYRSTSNSSLIVKNQCDSDAACSESQRMCVTAFVLSSKYYGCNNT